MSAKHKRPFVVFAAVAVVCCMVLVSGDRSKADGGRAPEDLTATVATADPPISPLPEATESAAPGSTPDADSEPGTDDGSAGTRDAELQAPRSENGSSDDASPAEHDSGVSTLPPFTIPLSPDSLPDEVDPGTVDEGLPSNDDRGKSVKRKDRGKSGFHGKPKDEDDEADEDDPRDNEALHGYPTNPMSEESDLEDQVDVEAEVPVDFDLEDED